MITGAHRRRGEGMKRIIGILILVGIFFALFVACALEIGVAAAALTFGAAFGMCALVILAAYLIAEG